MPAAQASRVGTRVGAVALTAGLATAGLLLGAGTASAEPRELICTVGGGPLGAPVSLHEGDRVQLVLIVPLLGTRLAVGPAQIATPGTDVLSGTVQGVIGLVGQLCRVAVQVQEVVTSVVPVPLPPLPTLPLPLPTEPIQLPLPGADVSLGLGGGSSSSSPSTGGPSPPPSSTTPPAAPGAPGSPPDGRFGPGLPPNLDFSRAPFGPDGRFGLLAPAFRFGQQVPGYAPQFGVLGADGAKSSQNAGKVRALPLGGSTAVALPVLMAVLLLSAVSGALARTWVLRRCG